MFTILPQRAFIMPRSTARDSRNTARRLVSITSSQSASFMRSARLSGVMPALFTRIRTSPNSFWIDSTSASHWAASLTSRTLPMAGTFCAPASLVAVPITFAPRRSPALPCPRAWSCSGHRLQRLLERSPVGERERLHFGMNAPGQRREHFSRSALDDVRRTLPHHPLDGLHPPHGRRRLADQRIL